MKMNKINMNKINMNRIKIQGLEEIRSKANAIILPDTWFEQAARLLMEGFSHMTDCWSSWDSALQEVRECFVEDRINRFAIDTTGKMVGWVGAIPQYDGHAWELHPIVVNVQSRNQGVGRLLLSDLEKEVGKRKGCTIYLGTDDEKGLTSLYGKDLYVDLLEQIRSIQNLKNHPFSFYQKCGFQIVGVLPDANGYGKPDILMAKRVQRFGDER